MRIESSIRRWPTTMGWACISRNARGIALLGAHARDLVERVMQPAPLPGDLGFRGSQFRQAPRHFHTSTVSMFPFCSDLDTTALRRLQVSPAPHRFPPAVRSLQAAPYSFSMRPLPRMKAPHQMRPGNRYAREIGVGRTLSTSINTTRGPTNYVHDAQ